MRILVQMEDAMIGMRDYCPFFLGITDNFCRFKTADEKLKNAEADAAQKKDEVVDKSEEDKVAEQ